MATSPVRRGGRGGGEHLLPERNAQYAELSLQLLRDYRTTLINEEHRVSYWRRIVHARVDLIRAVEAGSTPGVAELTDLFADPRPVSRRAALVALHPVDDLPPLPDLLSVWSQEPSPDDSPHNRRLLRELEAAERQLSSYRRAVHQRLASATAELIARYREEPTLCLSVLPLDPPVRSAGLG